MKRFAIAIAALVMSAQPAFSIGMPRQLSDQMRSIGVNVTVKKLCFLKCFWCYDYHFVSSQKVSKRSGHAVDATDGKQPVSPEIHSVTLMFFFLQICEVRLRCAFLRLRCLFLRLDFCGFRVHFCGFRVHLPVAYLPATTVPARWTAGQLWM